MRSWLTIPIGLLVLVLIALPAAALTETWPEHEFKEALGFDLDDCEPMTDLASPWQTRAEIPFKVDEPRGVGLGDDVYLVGGITGLQELASGRLILDPSNELTRFDPASERFEQLAPLPRRLNHIGVVAYRGDLYVLGGYGRSLSHHTSRAFFRYTPETDSWSRLPDMPEPKAAMASGVVGDSLIVAGGARDNVPVASAYQFDFNRERWSRLPEMPDRREHVGSAVLDGSLYVLGGRSEHSLAVRTVSRYNVINRRWEGVAPLLVASGGLGAVAVNGRIFAIGGGNDGAGTVTGAVQEWDPETATWALRAGMRTPRHGDEVAVTGDTIWALGGSPCAYYNATDIVESLQVSDAGA